MLKPSSGPAQIDYPGWNTGLGCTRMTLSRRSCSALRSSGCDVVFGFPSHRTNAGPGCANGCVNIERNDENEAQTIEGEERFFTYREGKSGSSRSGDLTEVSSLPISTEEFDRRFDDGESLDSLGVDLSKARRPGLEIKRITVDLPAPFLDRLDHWAEMRGMTRQALIKSRLYDRLEKQSQ